MAERQLKVAVVGVGHLGRIHAKIYAENERAELGYVVDIDGDLAQAAAREHGAQALSDPRELPDDVDAVSVVVPTVHHASVAIPLLERGIPLLIEKPLAGNLDDADRILAAARASGTKVAVGHVERFQPGVRRLREMDLQPRFIECHRLAPFQMRAVDVGVVHDLMIHDLDLILHLVDSPVASIDVAGGAILTDSEDVVSVRLVFENGARANVTASRASLKPMRRFRMFSGEGYVSLDLHENHGLVVRKGPNWDAQKAKLAGLDPARLGGAPSLDWMTSGMVEVTQLELASEQRPLQAELESFLKAVQEDVEPEVTGADGRRALELADRVTAALADQTW
ncbi:MAG: putative dehydrogenase [Chlamydiales bacterium]|jgi:predicted dehydrogenase